MKAITYKKYGSPKVLQLEEIPKPIPKDDELLVKIHASSVNNWDWDRLTGKPYLYRLLTGITKPKLNILGADIAGVVESAGAKVTQFKPGDQVYGDMSEGNWGGFAEFAIAKENALAIKPGNMTFEQAASIPQGGVMAAQAILDVKNLSSKDQILINGAAGAVGTFLIQFAKMHSVHITAVDSTEKQDFLLSLGADEVIDYKKEDFTRNGKKYDLILDVMAKRSVFDYKRSLAPQGAMSVIGGSIWSIIQIGLIGPLIIKKRKQKMEVLMHKPNKYLDYINELFISNKVTPIIDKVFPLVKTAEAIHYLGDGKVMGKVIIKVL